MYFLFKMTGVINQLTNIYHSYLKTRKQFYFLRRLWLIIWENAFFINRSKSTEDLLSMSQTNYDQLHPLSRSSRSHQLCLCDQNTVSCSYKYNGCKTRERGKEYLCGLHTNSRRKRDIRRFASFIKHDEEFNGLSVT